MYVCYIDESGTSDIPGNTSHFILAGVSVPIWHWHDADREVRRVLARYDLENAELHTAWLLRSYREQSTIPNFAGMNRARRRSEATRKRNAELLRLQQGQNPKKYRQTKKNYRHTDAYIHLTRQERTQAVSEVADCVSKWGFARLFAECIDKLHFDPTRVQGNVDEQAFEQVVSRFEQYLSHIERGLVQRIIGGRAQQRSYGLLVHDNNQSIAQKHTRLMKHFHNQGTLWTNIKHLIETPLFVDSSLTRMVQVADLCSYALRRYLENGETDLFNRVFSRADRFQGRTVGVRHYSASNCKCDICQAH